MADILALESVSIEYRNRKGVQRILDDVSLAIAPGEAYGLVGESGCGKSTIALAAMRYLPRGMAVTNGRLLFEGGDIASLGESELRRLRGSRVAMVYQDPMSSLNPVMTVGDQLIEVPIVHGETNRGRARIRAAEILREVRLPDPEAIMARYPHQLSGGQQQRVIIAMALMAEPKLLIMDEPTTGLDVTIEAAILELVRDLRKQFGAAILFISHNLGTIARICDRIGVLYAGRLVETGPIADVFRTPAHPYTRGLLAALPRLDAGRGQRLTPIEGTLLAADRARPGCAFAPRCQHAQPAVCETRPIELTPVNGSAAHNARCARLGALPAVIASSAQAAESEARGPGEILLATSGLTKRYPGVSAAGGGRVTVNALTDVSLTARAGETLAIVGESGSGKSTFAKIVSGLLTATAGAAVLDGIDVAMVDVDKRPRDLRSRAQMIFQNPDSTLNPSHSVEFALSRPLRLLKGLDKREARKAAAGLLERVRLPAEMLSRMPHQLSGGQRQRVAVARALAGDPSLLIADEPVSALDVSVQAAIVNLLSSLRDSANIGLVLISHDLSLVRNMADWVAVMYLGRVVESGPADQVFAGPSHPYTEALIAAAPRPDPDAPPPAVILSGAMPSPSEAVRGCGFASRCPKKLGGICDTEPPPWRMPNGADHRIACHIEFPA